MSLTTTSLLHPLFFGRFRNRDNRDIEAAVGQPNAAGPNANKKSANPTTSESLFGPNIGLISPGPSWTLSSHPRKTLVSQDDLTPEIVKSWIEKSKQPSYPTTTLQALVNLKRPSIKLSPLTSDTDEQQQQSSDHGFEFSYDADSPKCGIYISVLLPPGHPDAPPESNATTGLARLTVFEMVVDGGFGKTLTVGDGAVLDLVRFEEGFKEKGDGATSEPAASTTAPNETHHRRRFTNFHFRRRSTAAGPALAVMDAENPASPTPSASATAVTTTSADDKDKDEGGVKITIRLEALDEQGRELESVNEQITYLQVVRFGAPPAPAAPTSSPHGDEDKDKDKGGAEVEEEDKRPWVVKVVKREATIGPHTFHLHEIYGLSSSSSSAPAAPPPEHEHTSSDEGGSGGESHTYPPPPITNTTAAEPLDDDNPSSECLLCLSSPREVVLLPCRHLVACKECALNMVEFGAGGNVVQPTEDEGAGPTAEENAVAVEGNAGEGPPAPPPVVITPTPPTTTRRKRKAKGWFCPVCRQPYTSLLRITTIPPPPVEGDGAEANQKKEEDSAKKEVDVTDGGFLGNVLRGLSTTSLSPSARGVAGNTEGGIGEGRAGDASDRV